MDPIEAKQQIVSQRIGVSMVLFGTLSIFVGCHYHYAELTTSAAGITGAGINMLTNQFRATLNNKQGGIVNMPQDTPAA